MKISLIVPTYNRTDITRSFLHNIIENHQDDLHEIIFSDDGSVENQVAVIEEFKDKFKIPCKIVIQQHKGFRSARVRNNGVRVSTGDYLCFLDQDCVPSPGYFRWTKHFANPNRFLITRPLYTTKEQKERILNNCGEEYFQEIHRAHKSYLRKVVFKDYFYYIGKHLGMGDRRPKLQANGFSLFKEKYELVNGFDENFIGWGHPDDDLGRRMYVVKVLGFNISHKAWTYHLWHKSEPSKKKGYNEEYYKNKVYNRKNVRAPIGLKNDSGERVTMISIS